ncbi:hypothetical protein CHS0354_020129 [Potamilus streckersoni]|uniref:SEFIR domain-containing protein n=1 Tax=Potamilus streckersoni TaxID=2493646 RepID=A0AAE0S4U4_9BIVA|nr:hypothetical protein CHS0354_020129 [Potamilus streckersoni]
MSRRQGYESRCVCACELGYEECPHSMVENSCKCRSCYQLDGQSDNEETMLKQPDSSSADEHEARGNVSLTDKSLSESTLNIHPWSLDHMPRRSRADYAYELCRRSEVENSCTCRSCNELDEHFDNEETLIKQPKVSSAVEHEGRGNVSAIGRRSSSDSTLNINSYSQDNRPRRTRSDIFTNPGSVSSGEDGSFRRLRLFCTCSSDSSYYLKQVVNMLKMLKNSGFEVRTDRYRNIHNVRDMTIAANIQDWLDGNIARADFVIVCISPRYLVDIQAPADGVPEADDNTLFTRYIYDQLRAEYYFNRCCHQKVIPVRFHDPYVPNTNIPSFMKTTIVYTYPNDLNDLVSFLNMNKNRSRLQPLM